MKACVVRPPARPPCLPAVLMICASYLHPQEDKVPSGLCSAAHEGIKTAIEKMCARTTQPTTRVLSIVCQVPKCAVKTVRLSSSQAFPQAVPPVRSGGGQIACWLLGCFLRPKRPCRDAERGQNRESKHWDILHRHR